MYTPDLPNEACKEGQLPFQWNIPHKNNENSLIMRKSRAILRKTESENVITCTRNVGVNQLKTLRYVKARHHDFKALAIMWSNHHT